MGPKDAPNQVTASITDDDDAPSATIALSGSPLAENGGIATVTATLSAASGQNVTVNLALSGTATGSGTDYTASGSSIVILAGATTGTMTLTGDDDSLDELAETIIVDIDTVTNGTEGSPNQVIASITDDDDEPSATIALSGSPLAENGGIATVTATLSAASGQDVTVNLALSGTATGSGTDYTASAASITILAGATTGTITLTGDDDSLNEVAETIIVDIDTVTNGTEGSPNQVTASITDDDAPPSATIALSGSPLAENGGIATVTATLSAVSGQDVTVNLGLTGTATGSGTDYTASGISITILAGATTGTITLTGDDDALNEVAETIIVDISTVTNGTEGSPNQVTASITDDDTEPSATIALSGSPLAENGGIATVTATLSAASGQDVTVNLALSGTATGSGTDYTASGSSITILAGATTGTMTLTGDDDSLDELAETIIVDIDTVTNGTEGSPNQVTASITDDDDEPSATIALTGSPLAENGGIATVTATLSAASGQNVTVNLALSGTATGSGTDYTASATSITILAGATTGTITLTGDDDSLDEVVETIIVDIDTVTNGTEGAPNQVTASITDDDDEPSATIALTGSPLAENGGIATVTASLSAASGQDVTVNLVLSGTATGSGTDYTASATSITILAGATTGSITLTGDDDSLDEVVETIIVDIDTVINGTEGAPNQVTASITDDDDEPSATIALSGSPLAENGGIATVTATLSAASGQNVTVNLALSGTAIGSGTDYTASGASITILAGATTGTITLTGDDDSLNEAVETIVVDIDTVTNGTEGSPNQVTASITDDDAEPSATIALSGSPLAENGGIATVTATLSAVSGQDVTINVAFSGTATGSGTDYTASAASITILAGATTGTLTLTGDDDALNEVTETIIVDIDTVINGTEGSPNQVTANITDDDAQPTATIALSGSPLAENGGIATVTATLSASSGQDITVNMAFSGSATGGGTDYTLSATNIVILAGATSGTITITGDDDTADEIDETVIVDIDTVVNGTEGSPNQVTATITDDDDPPTVTLAVSPSTIAEAGGISTFTATLSAASSFAVTVDLGFSGAATFTDDYTRSGTQIVIAPGATSGSVTVTAVQDTLDENNEDVTVDITSVTNGTESGAQQESTGILDDDLPPTVTLSSAGSPFAENGGVATFTATLSTASGLPVTVDLGFSGTATGSGTDYTASSASIIIPPGSTSGTMTTAADDDLLDELNETIIVDITTVNNGTETGTQQETVTITDDDNEPSVDLVLSGAPIGENGGTAFVTANLSAASGQDVTVTFVFSGVPIGGGVDYTVTTNSITILAGATSGAISLTGVDDSLSEGTESIIVDIDTVTNGTEGSPNQVIAAIADDDPLPSVTLSLTGSPLAENGGIATVTATLSAVAGRDIIVDLVTSGTAIGGGTDYTLSTNSITILEGATTGVATITGDDDALDEVDETVIVDIDSVTNGTEGSPNQVTATITDDDAEPSVTLSLTGSPLAENGGIATVTATLSAVSGKSVTVDVLLSGTATGSGTDYTASTVSIVIPPGSATGVLTLTGDDDALDEVDETIIVDIDTVTNGTEGAPNQVTATITDDDDEPSVTLAVTGTPLAENGGIATVTATLSAVSTKDITVNLAYTGTAVGSGTDYTTSGTSIVILAGATSGTVTVTGDDDALDEFDETVIVDIDTVVNGTEGSPNQVTATITDDDDPAEVNLSLSGSPLAENGGIATVTATLDVVSAKDVTVNLVLTGTATGTGTDYTASSASITILAGATTGTITLTGDDDALDEVDETIIVDIDTVTNGDEGASGQVTATITDDDLPPVVTLSLTGSPLAENGGIATVSATLDAVSAKDVTVDVLYSGTADGAGTDYTASTASVTILAGATTGVITITGDDDLLDEVDETVIVDIDSVTNGTEGSPNQVTATITDDDDGPAVSLSLAGSPLAENGGIATVTATLNAVSAKNVTVDLVLSGTAIGSGTDYTASAVSITILAGSTNGTITITGDDDALDEVDETVIVDIDAVTNGTEGAPNQVTATITDDDPPANVTLSLTGSPLAENGGIATVTATLDAVSAKDVTINLALSGTAAGSGVDYTASGASIIILAGATTGTITVTGDDDLLDEFDETVIVDIDTVVNGVEDAPNQVTATITDDDDPADVTLSLTGSPLAENAGIATVTATLDTISGKDVTVTFVLSGDAISGTDYTPSTTNIVISAGSTTGAITLTGDDDALDEIDESIVVDIDTVTNGTEGTPNQVIAIITDDDEGPAVTLSIAGTPLAENGGVATVTATLDAVSAKDVTVNLGYTGTATGSGTDYTASTAAIVISAGNLTGTATITGDDDLLDEFDETVIVDITTVDEGTELGSQQVTATITDDDDLADVTLSLGGSPLAENGGIATVTATLDTPSGKDVTVTVVLSGTAVGSGQDYTASTTNVTILAGATTGVITLTGDNDALDELDETIIVDIDTVTNGTEGSPNQVTATITDDDPPPTVTLAIANTPFDENAGVATVTATLDTPSELDVTVNFAFSGTAAGAGVDYTASSASIIILAGATSGTITLTGDDDVIDEADETVIVDIDTITNGLEGSPNQVTGTITDDDDASVSLSLAGSPLAENGGIATVTATLSIVSSTNVTVNLAFTGVAQGAGVDYTASSASITILAGSTNGTITLTGDDDTLYETDEDIIVDIDSVVNAIEGAPNQVTATITDDDPQPTVTLAVSTTPIDENGGVTTFTATLDTASGLATTINLAFSGDAVGGGVDYTASTNSIVIPAGALTGTMILTADDDLLDELDETVTVDIDTITNGLEGSPNQQSAVITDDDLPPLVSLALAGSPFAENGGVGTVNVNLDAVSGLDVTVTLLFSGTAIDGTDYTKSAAFVTILAGATNGFVTLTGDDDTIYETDETVIVDIDTTGTTGTEDGVQQVTATITDDEAQPDVTLTVLTSPIPELGGIATVRATLSHESAFPTTVNYSFSAGTATLTDDYTRSATNVVVGAGSFTGDILITAVDDTIFEADETVTIDIDSVVLGTENTPQTVIVEITDDEPAPLVSLAISGTPLAENGGIATVTVSQDRVSSFDTIVPLVLTGTAIGGGTDYTASTTTVTIVAGTTNAVMTITGDDDLIDEFDETVIVDIDGPGVVMGTEDGVQQVIATITDDDLPANVTLVLADSPFAETGGVAVVTVTLDVPSGKDITVGLVYSGTATSAIDYTSSTNSVTILAGATTADVTLTGIDDCEDDDAETVIVDIDSVVNGLEDTPGQVTATITDDDITPSDIVMDSQDIDENETSPFSVGNFTTTDGNLSDTHIYTLVSGVGDTDNGSFNILVGELRANAAFDHETKDSYTVRIRTTDPCGLFYEEDFVIMVNDVNDAPIVNNATHGLDENSGNGTLIANVGATDEDLPMQTLFYQFDAGNVNSAFLINSSGEIRVNDVNEIDYETTQQYMLTVRVTDSGFAPAMQDTATITIDITNLNEAPEMTPQSFSMSENLADGIVVYTVTSSDPDTLGPASFNSSAYSIIGGTGAAGLSIDNDGVVTVSGTVDFETFGGSNTIIVQVEDGGAPALSDTITLTNTIAQVDPLFFEGTASVAVDDVSFEFNSVSNVLYDVYTSPDPVGAGMTWTKIVDASQATATSVVVNATASEDERFYLVVDRGDPIDTNAMWGVVRRDFAPVVGGTTQAGYNMMSAPLNTDGDFSGEFGAMLGEDLTGDNGGVGDLIGDEAIILETNGTWTTLYLDAVGVWRDSGGSAATNVLSSGQGFYLLNNDTTAKSGAFIGVVGNKAAESVVVRGGEWNFIGLSRGQKLTLDHAFSDLTGGTLVGSFDENEADIIAFLTADGTFRRFQRASDSTWRSLDPSDFWQIPSDMFDPGEGFFFFRQDVANGGGDLTITF